MDGAFVELVEALSGLGSNILGGQTLNISSGPDAVVRSGPESKRTRLTHRTCAFGAKLTRLFIISPLISSPGVIGIEEKAIV